MPPEPSETLLLVGWEPPSILPSIHLLPCWPRLLPESLLWEERGHRRSIKLSHHSLFPLLSPSKLPVALHQWPVWQPGAQGHWGGRNVRYISTHWRKTTGAVRHDNWGGPLFRQELFWGRKSKMWKLVSLWYHSMKLGKTVLYFWGQSSNPNNCYRKITNNRVMSKSRSVLFLRP